MYERILKNALLIEWNYIYLVIAHTGRSPEPNDIAVCEESTSNVEVYCKPTCNIKQIVFVHKIISLQATPTDFIIVSIRIMQIKYDIECKGNIFFEISKI